MSAPVAMPTPSQQAQAAEKTGAAMGGAAGKALAMGLVFHQGMRGVASGAQLGWATAGVRSGSDALGGARAQIAQMEALGGIPIIGDLTKAFDGLLGITRGLNMQLAAMAKIESGRVHLAEMTGDPVAAAEARGGAKWRDVNRRYYEAAKSNWYGGSNDGSAEAQALAAEREFIGKENARELQIAREQKSSMMFGLGARASMASMSMQRADRIMGGNYRGVFVMDRAQQELAMRARHESELAGTTGDIRTKLEAAQKQELAAFAKDTTMQWRATVNALPMAEGMGTREIGGLAAYNAIQWKQGMDSTVQDEIAVTLKDILVELRKTPRTP